MNESIIVKAEWDDEARVWVATSDDVPGLSTEAASLEALKSKLLIMIEELIELNGHPTKTREIPVHIVTHQLARVTNPRAA